MKADINVTPLIDVLLVLLIIFMLVAPVAPRALDASLPRTPDDPGGPTPAGLVLEVRAEGLALNTMPVLTLEDLDRRLRAAFETRADRTLVVRASGDVAYERVVAAVDVARGAGASRIGLVDERPTARP
jgi:biopolymer transport protein ExbD